MDTTSTTRRKVIRRLLWLSAAGGILLALLPLWFPWVLKPALNHFGLRFAGYDRMGWTRFALTGVKGTWKSTRIEVERVQCLLPTAWLWRMVAGGTNGQPVVTVAGGTLWIARTTTNTLPAGRAGSADNTLNQIGQAARRLQRLLPSAALTNGTVQVASVRVGLPRMDWRGGWLHAVVRLPESHEEIELAGQLEGKSSFRLAAKWDAHDLSLQGEFSRAAEGWRWEGEGNWLTNRAILSARFATNGWWPAQARLDCAELKVPARLIHLPGYEDLTATLAANLASNRFSLQATGLARPSGIFAEIGFPAAHFSLAADGDPEAASLRRLNIQSPWLNAELTNAVAVTRKGELLENPAQFRVSMDLSHLPGATLAGQLEGLVRVQPRGGRTPTAQFSFTAQAARLGRVAADSVIIRGELAPPELKLDGLAVRLADGAEFSAGGTFDFERRQILKGGWQCSGAILKQFLTGWDYDALTGSGHLSGPLTNLAHDGEVILKNFQDRWLKPLHVHARWAGANLRFDSVDVELTGGESILSARGAVDLSALKQHQYSVTLTNLSFRRGGEELYALRHPCAIALNTGGTNAAARNRSLAVDAFDWQGVNRGVSVTAGLAGPARGYVTATLTNLALSDFAELLQASVTNLSLTGLEVAARWSNGPVHSTIFVDGAVTARAGERIDLRCVAATGETLSLDRFSVQAGRTPAFALTGNVPVKIIPGRAEGWLLWDESQAIALAGNWEGRPPQQFALPLGPMGELAVTKPELQVQVSGTPTNPAATLKVAAATVTWQARTNHPPHPGLENLRLGVELRPDDIELSAFSVQVDGQPMAASGGWPLAPGAWRALWADRKLPDWSRAHGRLELHGAQVAALARYLPQALAPEGSLTALVELKPDRQFEGFLSLTNAATRTLGTLTPLRDIAAQVRLDGDRAELQEFRGQIGGQPVRADGHAAWSGPGSLSYQVHLRGTNVPLARSPELLLRGNFDLWLRGGSNLPPALSGGLQLHNGLFVQHAAALVWSGPRRPALRPPYFSVTNAPLADWKLDFTISGNRFLRARTPVFGGLLSVNLKLQGTLRAPVLTGDVRVDSGLITFPFGTLNVNQGYAGFSGNDPQGPDLQFNASGRNYDYDVRLNVKGPAGAAELMFSSTPPLTSEQILLMLTAGTMPQTTINFSSKAKAGRLAGYLGQDLYSRFLGGGQKEERLIIRTGERVSAQGQSTYAVEYRLTDRWSIIGEYDEYNAFNTDLKWMIYNR